jgi:hypothetical protein
MSYVKQNYSQTTGTVPGTISMSTERFQITVESIGGQDVPPVIRLRGWLKLALRAFGLRVVTARELTESTAEGVDST